MCDPAFVRITMKLVIRLLSIVFVFAAFVIAAGCPSGGGPCTKNDDCTPGQVCSGDKCVDQSEATDPDGGNGDVAPKKCEKDEECADTEACVDKACAAIPAKCTDDKQCRAADKCDKTSGKCYRPCAFDEDCPANQACDAKEKRCVDVKACEKAEDCPDGQTCNTCRKICTPSVGQKCNEDFNCTDLGGSDKAFCDKCINECRKRGDLCEPCSRDDQCGQDGDLCLPDILNPASGKKFCAKACQNGLCPAQYKCQNFKDKDPADQCIPASNNCTSPGECQSNADCVEQGKICNVATSQCIAGCEVDENCPVRTTSESCTVDGDCINKAAKCVGGTCTVQLKCCRGRCGAPCDSSSECEQQEQCTDGCCKIDGECRTSKDCKDKEYCDTKIGICVAGCQTPDDCGATDPSRARCRWKCQSNQCVEDCTCRSPVLDCTAIRFCPTKEAQDKDPLAPCRKPNGPACKPCSGNLDCGCKDGDDCKYKCTKVECQSDAECAQLPNAKSCYNGRCSSKKACRKDADCPSGERCENGFCAEACNNLCVQASMSTRRCAPGCDIRGDGSECPSRMPCTELLDPNTTPGAACKGTGGQCKTDADCSGDEGRCGEDGYCTDCKTGQVCRNLDQMDPTKLVCVQMPPTVCVAQEPACVEGGL